MEPKVRYFANLLVFAPMNFYSPLGRETILTKSEIDVRTCCSPHIRISYNEIIVRKCFEITIKGSYTLEECSEVIEFLKANNIDKPTIAYVIDLMSNEIEMLMNSNRGIVHNPY